MSIPDYISPIIGYRVWQWVAAGLKSLNGEPWSPGKPLAAACRASNRRTTVGRAEPAHDANDAPQEKCRCGVYASKSREHLRTTGYERYGICGEVNLWGTVVEHEQGFRAQFAYPKNLYLPLKMLPITLAEIQSRLQALTLYGSDIFVLGNGETISLWGKDSGFDPAGLDYLIERSKRYYDRRQQDRTLKKGDRVAILGQGIAVVERADETEVEALLENKTILRMRRNDIAWNRQNMRWEAEVLAVILR
jgi:preprotein translocase subunit YajC